MTRGASLIVRPVRAPHPVPAALGPTRGELQGLQCALSSSAQDQTVRDFGGTRPTSHTHYALTVTPAILRGQGGRVSDKPLQLAVASAVINYDSESVLNRICVLYHFCVH